MEMMIRSHNLKFRFEARYRNPCQLHLFYQHHRHGNRFPKQKYRHFSQKTRPHHQFLCLALIRKNNHFLSR